MLAAQYPTTSQIGQAVESDADAFGTWGSLVFAAAVTAQACDQAIGLGQRQTGDVGTVVFFLNLASKTANSSEV